MHYTITEYVNGVPRRSSEADLLDDAIEHKRDLVNNAFANDPNTYDIVIRVADETITGTSLQLHRTEVVIDEDRTYTVRDLSGLDIRKDAYNPSSQRRRLADLDKRVRDLERELTNEYTDREASNDESYYIEAQKDA